MNSGAIIWGLIFLVVIGVMLYNHMQREGNERQAMVLRQELEQEQEEKLKREQEEERLQAQSEEWAREHEEREQRMREIEAEHERLKGPRPKREETD